MCNKVPPKLQVNNICIVWDNSLVSQGHGIFVYVSHSKGYITFFAQLLLDVCEGQLILCINQSPYIAIIWKNAMEKIQLQCLPQRNTALERLMQCPLLLKWRCEVGWDDLTTHSHIHPVNLSLLTRVQSERFWYNCYTNAKLTYRIREMKPSMLFPRVTRTPKI